MLTLPQQDLDHVLENTPPDVWKRLAGQRVFLTGGTGFVGKWLLETLAHANRALGLKVSCTVLSRDPGRFGLSYPHLTSDNALQFWEGDVLDGPLPTGEFGFVVHAATEASRPPTAESPTATFERDLAVTRRMLEFARERGTERFLFTSSGAVYGEQPPELTHIGEDYAGAPLTTDVRTFYGQAKRASEFLCCMYARQYGFCATVARLFAFLGPYLPLDLNFAAGNFLADTLAERPIRIKGDGSPYRSYLYAADLAIWLWTILVRGQSARAYNVGSERAVSVAELAEAYVAATGSRCRIEIAQSLNPGALRQRYVPSTSRAESELGLRSHVSLEEGIARFYSWAVAGKERV